MSAACTVMMIRPVCFGYDAEAAATNAFQNRPLAADADLIRAEAVREVEDLAATLERAGVEVMLFDDIPSPAKPDAVFCNNWISTHPDGSVVLYPMQPAQRRAEVRTDVVESLVERGGGELKRVIDLRQIAGEGRYLEGTGSLVIDHREGLVFASLSARTDHGLCQVIARLLDLELIAFIAADRTSVPLYHTNVALSIADDFALVCLQAVRDARARKRLRESLGACGRNVIELDFSELEGFAGNALALANQRGESLLALSTTAAAALRPATRDALAAHTRLLECAVPTLERVGGGSVRCCLAEIFIPCVANP